MTPNDEPVLPEVPMFEFFAVLDTIETNERIKEEVSKYRSIYGKLNEGINWDMLDDEREILEKFVEEYSNNGLRVEFKDNRSSVEINDAEKAIKYFEEYTKKLFLKDYEEAFDDLPEIKETSQVDERGELVDIATTQKKYKIIYAAPKWEKYPSIEKLLEIPVKRISSKNSVLLLWIQASRLPEALKVIDAWGFTYKTILFMWQKKDESDMDKFLSNKDWTRENGKICLLSMRGNISKITLEEILQATELPVEHEKEVPTEFKKLTVKLFVSYPAIELFSKEPYNDENLLRKWDACFPK